MIRYRLEGHTPVPDLNDDPLPWAEWLESADRQVALTTIPGKLAPPSPRTSERCPAFVSTVFLGLDHRFSGKGPPLVFETMVFCEGPFNGDCERYSTWDEALAGHARMAARVLGPALRVLEGGKAKAS